MAKSVYKIIELVGASTKSWEDAAKAAVETAGQSLKELRIAEVSELDMQLNKGKVISYRGPRQGFVQIQDIRGTKQLKQRLDNCGL